MKRSRFLSKQFSINDVLYNPRTPKSTSNFINEPHTQKLISSPQIETPQSDLFKGLSFKRFGSLDATDSQESPVKHSFHSSPNIDTDNPLELEKIKLKMQKSEQSEKLPKRLDPNRHLWQGDNVEQTLKKVMTLRHMSQIENKSAKINFQKISGVIDPKNE